MLDIGTVKTSVYARWPKELNFDEVLERLINESPKLLQGVAVHWGKDDSLGDVCNALEKLDDKDLAEKYGGDRVEFVNRHSWEV